GSLWELGLLLGIYDGAEVVLKPVFGALADRIGAKPVMVGGLVVFAGPLPRSWSPVTRICSGRRAWRRAPARPPSPPPPRPPWPRSVAGNEPGGCLAATAAPRASATCLARSPAARSWPAGATRRCLARWLSSPS